MHSNKKKAPMLWGHIFYDDIGKFAMLLCFGPPIYALNKLEDGSTTAGWIIIGVWLPIHIFFIGWLHKRKKASLWLTIILSILVVGGYAVLQRKMPLNTIGAGSLTMP